VHAAYAGYQRFEQAGDRKETGRETAFPPFIPVQFVELDEDRKTLVLK
jgi:hypothetical protein